MTTNVRMASAETRSRVAQTRRGKKAVVVYLDRDDARRLKVLAAQNDTTLQALGVEAIDLLFRQYDDFRDGTLESTNTK